MKQKKLLLLGGIRYLLPVIEAAHRLGAYVITADYLPNNIAHKYSDEYVNVSILDRKAILKIAQEKQIDGILSFGVDPGVVTAAYVAEKMGLPSPPLVSVEILQNKDKFRDFLAANGFNCPWHISLDLSTTPTASTTHTNPNNPNNISLPPIPSFPCIVKPVDSAGSKGCSRVDRMEDILQAIAYARSESHSGHIIIEQFLELQGHQTGSDSFSINNELVFCSFDSQYFDASASNPYTPSAHIWPSDMPMAAQDELRRELQRLIKLLNLGTSIYNIEARVATDGKPYIMEVSPRGGGNRLSEVLRSATGKDIITANVYAALGLPIQTFRQMRNHEISYDGIWVDFIIHSPIDGVFQSVSISPAFTSAHVREQSIYVNPGDRVSAFTGANAAIGTLFLRFETYAEAEYAVRHPEEWLKVEVS